MEEGPKVPVVSTAEKKKRSTLKNIEFILFDQSIVTRSLFVLAIFYTLYFAANLLVPICLAFLLYFLLYPIVNFMQKKAFIPRSLGSAIVILILLFCIAFAFYFLSAEAQGWIDMGPAVFVSINQKIMTLTSYLREPLQFISSISESISQSLNISGSKAAAPTNFFGLIFSNTYQFLVEFFMLLIVLYFLLAAKNFFLTKIVKVLLHLKRKKEANIVVQQIEEQVWKYLFVRTVANIGVAIFVSLMLWAFQLPSPILWGVMAGILEFIPFVGAVISTFVILLVCLLSFDSGLHILLPPICFAVFVSLQGNLYVPYLLGKSMTINQIAIVFSIFLFGSLWGVMGSFLAIPLLMTIKIIMDNVNEDNFLKELLSE